MFPDLPSTPPRQRPVGPASAVVSDVVGGRGARASSMCSSAAKQFFTLFVGQTRLLDYPTSEWCVVVVLRRENMKKSLILFTIALLTHPFAGGGAQTALARMWCLSLRVQPGVDGFGISTLELSTLDSVSN